MQQNYSKTKPSRVYVEQVNTIDTTATA